MSENAIIAIVTIVVSGLFATIGYFVQQKFKDLELRIKNITDAQTNRINDYQQKINVLTSKIFGFVDEVTIKMTNFEDRIRRLLDSVIDTNYIKKSSVDEQRIKHLKHQLDDFKEMTISEIGQIRDTATLAKKTVMEVKKSLQLEFEKRGVVSIESDVKIEHIEDYLDQIVHNMELHYHDVTSRVESCNQLVRKAFEVISFNNTNVKLLTNKVNKIENKEDHGRIILKDHSKKNIE